MQEFKFEITDEVVTFEHPPENGDISICGKFIWNNGLCVFIPKPKPTTEELILEELQNINDKLDKNEILIKTLIKRVNKNAR